jgi:hypothetical protein
VTATAAAAAFPCSSRHYTQHLTVHDTSPIALRCVFALRLLRHRLPSRLPRPRHPMARASAAAAAVALEVEKHILARSPCTHDRDREAMIEGGRDRRHPCHDPSIPSCFIAGGTARHLMSMTMTSARPCSYPNDVSTLQPSLLLLLPWMNRHREQ